jgi:hypothetical protein
VQANEEAITDQGMALVGAGGPNDVTGRAKVGTAVGGGVPGRIYVERYYLTHNVFLDAVPSVAAGDGCLLLISRHGEWLAEGFACGEQGIQSGP